MIDTLLSLNNDIYTNKIIRDLNPTSITENNSIRQLEVPTGTYFAKDETTTHHIINIGKRRAQFLIIEYK